MQLGDIDWRVLRGSIIVAVIAFAIAGALVYGGHQISSEAAAAERQSQNRSKSARARYLTLDDEKRLIEEFAPQYAALENAGLIGDERRLSWIETLRTVAKGMKMPALRYEIGAQERFEPDYPLPAGTFTVYGTEMRLQMGLLHAADLPAIFAALGEAARGLFTVTGCSLARPYAELGEQIDPSKANLSVQCRLRWLVTRKPSAPA